MSLFLLRPIEGLKDDPWDPWYDRCFGFVVRAENEYEARDLAQANGNDETAGMPGYIKNGCPAWTDPKFSTCEKLQPDHGEAEVIMRDVHSA